MEKDGISASGFVATGRRDGEQARLEGKAPSTEQQGREKDADDFNRALQEGPDSASLGMVRFHKALLSLGYFTDAHEAAADNLSKPGTAYAVL